MSTPKRKRGCNTSLSRAGSSLYRGILRSYLSTSNHSNRDYLLDLIDRGDFPGLLEWSELSSPQLYDSASSYFEDAQMSSLIRKYPFSSQEVPGLDPEATAIRTFIRSEHRCGRINLVTRLRRRQRIAEDGQFWQDARTWIARVIGETPDVSAILGECDFTGGASVGVHGNATNIARKLTAEKWSCTPAALPYAVTALWLNQHAVEVIQPDHGGFYCHDPEDFRDRVRQRVERTSCNNITFVPKTAKTHRSIAVEPLLNGFVQKGADVYLRRKLRKVGIDLSDQRYNQVLAWLGSRGGSDPFCTIDLASASDSLAIEVVRDLLPPDWFEFLDSIRSPRYRLRGQDYSYEKFCSMGNGFCFPLQTLIFASVCHAANRYCGRDSTFAVYGDDIVVPQSHALLVIEKLRTLGFKTNRDKTFVTGQFRESCGRDWFNGQDVRPVMLDKIMTDVRQLCAFHNSTYRSEMTEEAFTGVRQFLRSFQPDLLRPGREPGDTCFSVPLDVAMASPLVRWRSDIYAWAWVEIQSKSRNDRIGRVGPVEKLVAYAVMRGAQSSSPFPLRYMSTPKRRVVARPWLDRQVTWFGDGTGCALNFTIPGEERIATGSSTH